MSNSLFQQIIELFKGKTPVSTSGTLTSFGNIITPNTTPSDINTYDEITKLKDDINILKENISNIPKQIVSGLDVYSIGQTLVAVTAGTAILNTGKALYTGGTEHIHDAAIHTKLNIDTSKMGVGYIQAKGGNIPTVYYTTTPSKDDLILAKIVIKYINAPIYDDNNDLNNYIVSGKDLVFDSPLRLDDETKTLIKDAISEVFAENLTGSMKLNEGLSITNQHDSIVLDSTSMKIKTDTSTLAEFNKDGVFFNDGNGNRLSQYTKDGATVGNIQVTSNSLKSLNYSSGNTGFIIKDDGNVEVNNIKARGNITALSGQIGKWVVGRDRLTDKNNTTGMAPEAPISGKSYPFYAGASFANRNNAPFRVTSSGAVYMTNAFISGNITANNVEAVSGHIGGWSINQKSLSGGVGKALIHSSGYVRLGTTSNIVQLDSRGSNRIWIGKTNSNAASFRVTKSGALFATGATITGNITANTISAVTGSVGGWKIGTGKLSGGTMVLYSSGVIHTTNFNVSNTGIISATSAKLKSATVSGNITANAGKIAGWNIATGKLSGGVMQLFSSGVIHSTNFNVSNTGVISATSAVLKSATVSGAITANSGKLGGWTVSTGKISGGVMKLYASGVINSTNFNVSNTGVVSATSARLKSATVSGAITATSITANASGTIAGWRLTSSYLSGLNTKLSKSGYISLGTTSNIVQLDTRSTNRIWVGKQISGNAPFRVTQSGKLYATGAVISGTIKASTISTVTGNIGGWSVSAGKISGGVMKLFSSGRINSTNFNVSNTGVVSATSAVLKSATVSGAITANSGKLGGWTVSAGKISGGVMKLYASGVINSTNFNVSNTGVISATSAVLKSATVSGNITANTITANTSGSIAGWKISSTKLSGVNTILSKSGYIKVGSLSNIIQIDTRGVNRVWVGATNSASASFRVTQSGKLYATGATITGNITANTISAVTGSIGGWKIGTNFLSGGVTKLYSSGLIVTNKLQASGGKIGGWTISSTKISSTKTILYASGRITTSLLSASNATISGVIRATSITANTSGTIAGWRITPSYLSGTNTKISKSGFITLGTGNNVVKIDTRSASRFWIGASAATTAPFRVTQSGKLYAAGAVISGTIKASTISTVTGSIGGWKIGTNFISGGVTKLYSSGLIVTNKLKASGGTIGGWTVGPTKISSAKTVLYSSGRITTTLISASNATISGVLRATSITANASGTIAGWRITSTALSGVNTKLSKSGYITLGTGANIVQLDTRSIHRLWVGTAASAAAPFRVTQSGRMYASNAIITGAVTANSGTIGGWRIGTNAISSVTGKIQLLSTGSGEIKIGPSAGNHIRLIGGGSGTSYIQSSNFSNSPSTPKGFRFSSDGTMEAVDGIFSGKLQSNVFVKNNVNVVNGDMILSNSTRLVASAAVGTTILSLDSGVFSVNDVLRISNSSEYMLVTVVSAATKKITVTRGFSTTSARTYNNKSVIYRVGIKSTNDKGYIELLGNSNVINIHDVDVTATTVTNATPVQIGLLTQGINAGKYGLYASTAQISGNITGTGTLNIVGNTNPTVVGTLSGLNSPSNVFVFGKFAYVLNQNANNMRIIDVGNSTSPSYISTLSGLSSPHATYVAGKYAYICDYGTNKLIIVDISNTYAPAIVGELSNIITPIGIFISGKYAYIASWGVTFSDGSLYIVDISNAASPILVGTKDSLAQPFGLYVTGKYAYVANHYNNTLSIVDISNPVTPSIIGTLTGLDSPMNVYVSGKYAYISNLNNGTVSIADISNPATPTIAGTINCGLAPGAIQVSGKYAYIAIRNGMAIADVSIPSANYIVGTLSGINPGLTPSSLYTFGKYTYIVTNSNKFYVVDIGGIESTSANIGNIFSNNLNSEQLNVFNTANIGGGLNVTGGLSVYGSSTISGAVTATSGKVGGWTINTTSLSGATGKALIHNSGYIRLGTTSNIVQLDSRNGNRFWVGAVSSMAAPFRITNSGAMYASKAVISGTITANTGNIGGWTITTTGLNGGSTSLNSNGTISSTGLILTGSVTASGSLGTEMLSGWNNGVNPWETFTVSGTSITNAINNGPGYGDCYSNAITVYAGVRYRIVFNILSATNTVFFTIQTSQQHPPYGSVQFRTPVTIGVNTYDFLCPADSTVYAHISSDEYGNGGMVKTSSMTIKQVIGGLLTVGGRVKIANGSAALPSLAFIEDNNTGFYKYANDAIGVAAAGINSMIIASTYATIPSSNPLYFRNGNTYIQSNASGILTHYSSLGQTIGVSNNNYVTINGGLDIPLTVVGDMNGANINLNAQSTSPTYSGRSGGSINIIAGQSLGAGSGSGGSVIIATGSGATGNGGAGGLVLRVGTAYNNNNGGSITLSTGSVLGANGATSAGNYSLTTGWLNSAWDAYGGSVTVVTGSGQGPHYGYGGSINYTTGKGVGATAGRGGSFNITLGSGTARGIFNFTQGNLGNVFNITNGVTSLNATLANGSTATTQAALDNSTKVATTAYVDTAVSGENIWNRNGTIITTNTANDALSLGTGAVQMSGTLRVKGATTLSSTLTIKGTTTLSAATASFVMTSTTGVNTTYTKYVNTGGIAFLGLNGSTGAELIAANGIAYSTLIRANKALQLATGDVVRITIASAGNIGIGTITPLYANLVINQSSYYSGNTSALAIGKVTSLPTATTDYGGIYLFSTDALAADKGGTITFGANYNGTGDSKLVSIFGGKENSTTGNLAGYFTIVTRASGGTLTERLRINSMGKVGIGTTAPTGNLTIRSDANTSVSSTLRLTNFINGGTNLGSQLVFGSGGTTESNQHTARIIGKHTTAGDTELQFWTNAGANYEVDTQKMVIDKNGNVGIGTGTTAVTNMLEVAGTTHVKIRNTAAGSVGASVGIMFAASTTYNTDATRGGIYAVQEATAAPYDQGFGFKTYSETHSTALDTRMYLNGTGDLQLRQTAVAHGITAYGLTTNTYGSLSIDSITQGGLRIWGVSDVGTQRALVHLGILGDAAPTVTVAAVTLAAGKKNGATVQALAATETVLKVENWGTAIVTAYGNGNVDVTGAFTATSKSFLIDHPTKPNMKLQYGSLEGPEHSVFVRGKTKTNVIELPDYWTGLVDAETITCNITPIGSSQNIYVEKIEDNKVFLNSDKEINCFYTIYGERKDVPKLEVEF